MTRYDCATCNYRCQLLPPSNPWWGWPPNIQSLYCCNWAAYCSISLKFDTDFDYVTADTLPVFRVRGWGHMENSHHSSKYPCPRRNWVCRKEVTEVVNVGWYIMVLLIKAESDWHGGLAASSCSASQLSPFLVVIVSCIWSIVNNISNMYYNVCLGGKFKPLLWLIVCNVCVYLLLQL